VCEDLRLFRTYRDGALAGVSLSPDWLRTVTADARLAHRGDAAAPADDGGIHASPPSHGLARGRQDPGLALTRPTRTRGRLSHRPSRPLQSLSSRHAVRAMLARVSPLGWVSSMPRILAICSSRRATLLWCRLRTPAARRTEPAAQ
jgi:hypothetical protein